MKKCGKLIDHLSTIFRHNIREILTVFLILCAAFTVRFYTFDHPLGANGADGSQNILIAKHIIALEEAPLTGPYNAFFGNLKNSPFYYYTLVPITLLGQSLKGILVIFIFIHLLYILSIYGATRMLFGRVAALVLIVLMSFAPVYILRASLYVWQPHVMEIFLGFAIFASVYAYKKQSIKMLYVGQIIFMCAVATHLSALLVSPLFFIFLYRCAYLWKGLKGVTTLIIQFVVTLCILFGPSVYVSLAGEGISMEQISNLTSSYADNFSVERILFFTEYGASLILYPLSKVFIVFTLVVGSVLYLLVPSITKQKKYYFLCCIGGVLLSSLIMFIVFLYTGNSQTRYFIPLTPFLFIVIGALFSELLHRTQGARLLGIALLFTVMAIYLQESRVSTFFSRIHNMERPRYNSALQVNNKVIETIERVKKERGYTDYRFFNFYGLRAGNYNVLSDHFWLPLEDVYQIPFAKLTPTGLHYMNRNDVVFLFCTKKDIFSNGYSTGTCLSYYTNERPLYTQIEPLYEDEYVSLFLTSKSLK